ncbi:uncharacterized protein K452DRAFT_337380 [Aplosporella prunicola CBS 121167]|uniref:MalT-like TPR region domain-containing protein n=1 Tax=Aplosporella prunicola CBS 121167 TaxID=1176127 RepID=A0A6A6B4X3_9PEZI|nr:uncharacterized protein K452DRAFT_337380 [Aplosporella prunicola CBS 121167]KAF2139229.1 hypothetical protein K452DRAFT_337380 [Aplosporella prunicola CBS 121167]
MAITHFLAGILSCRGNHEEAEQIHRRTFHDSMVLLGPECQDTLIYVNGFSGALSRKNKLDEAEVLLRHIVLTMKRAGSEDTMNNLIYLGGLANLLRRAGKLEEAEKLLRKVVAGHTMLLGLRCRKDKFEEVWNFFMQNKFEEAHEICKKVVNEKERVFDKLDSDRLESCGQFGVVLQCMGRYEDAEGMHRKAWEGWGELLGENDWAAKTSLKDLKLALWCQGKVTETDNDGNVDEIDGKQVWDYSKPGPHRKHICHWRDRIPPEGSNVGQEGVNWDEIPSALEGLSIAEAVKQGILSNGEKVER